MKGILYWHPRLYRLALKWMYKEDYDNRYRHIANEAAGLDILDIGCGDCQLYQYVDKKKYMGVDVNDKFLSNARKRGVNVKLLNVIKDDIPKTECIVMSGILSQIFPNHEQVIRKVLKSATKKVIIAESMQHTTDSKIARILDHPGYNINIRKLNKNELVELFKKFKAYKIMPFRKDIMAIFLRNSK